MLSPQTAAVLDTISGPDDAITGLKALADGMDAVHTSLRWYGWDGELKRQSTVPDAWGAYYDSRGYVAVDPGPKRAQVEAGPFHMAFCPKHPSYFARGGAREMFNEMRELDIHGALIVPLGVERPGPRPLAAFYTAVKPDAFDAWLARAGLALQLGALLVHERATRSAPLQEAKNTGGLTPRERDCLATLAAGHRIDRIADRLSLSNRTVEFHLRNARDKLGAKTREHAIARAVAAGIVEV